MRKIFVDLDCNHNLQEARIGGGAFIGGILDWPKTNDGKDLTLIASIPANLVNATSNYRDKFISVFSFYSEDYFVDEITYHGNDDELDYIIEHGTTKVIVHDKGNLVQEAKYIIKPMRIMINEHDELGVYQGSGFGNPPGFIQNKNIGFDNMTFVLQLYSSDFPHPYKDIFCLTDSVGYLYINKDMSGGLFFTQVS
jgi:hypothetical protein